SSRKRKPPHVRGLELQRLLELLASDREGALGIDADLVSLPILVLELHYSVHESEDRIIGSETDVGARMKPGAVLPNDDVAGAHALAAEPLHTLVLRVAVAAVARGADSFLMCHLLFLAQPRLMSLMRISV